VNTIVARLLALVLVVAAFGACGDDNKVGSGVDLGIKSQVEQQRLGARTTTTAAAVATTVATAPTGKAGLGEATTTTARPVTTTAAPTTTAVPEERIALEISINGDSSGTTQFEPSAARVFVGSLVKWTNKDTQPRSIEADSGAFNSGTLQPGESFTYKATAAGKFNYHDGTRPYAVGSLEAIAR
jgi:plastocyanin